ncbi:MAG: o-succinylbenzoate--CoA ligase, partial [Halobacteriales archaeon]|nr:o-succinylbenzoate--CoA ligase [Halobacteriales archaeon]
PWTWAALDAQAGSLAARLARLGTMPGHHVATLLPPSAQHVALLHAIWRIGAVAVPLDPRLPGAELERRARHAQARIAIAQDAVRIAPRNVALPGLLALAPARFGAMRPDPDRLAALLHTSGTSGAAKAAMLTFGNLEASARASAQNLGVQEQDRWLAAVPLFHVGGLAAVARAALDGTALVLHARFDAAQVRRAFDADAVTLAALVPTMLRRVLDVQPGPLPAHMRGILLGGDAAPPGLLAECARRGVPVLPTYGLTEACSQVATAPPGAKVPEGAVGKPLPGVEVSIGEAGEILVRGPTVFAGYWRDEAATHAALRDGWLHTGDLGRLEAAGWLHVLGRIADRIVTGGEKVDPALVEAALREHRGVEDACVIGLAHPEWGAQVVAAVALRPGAAWDPAALEAHCRARLAGWQVPRRWLRVPSLPRNATGKVARDAVRALFQG